MRVKAENLRFKAVVLRGWKSTTRTVYACFCASCVDSGLSVCAGAGCALWLVHPARIQKGQPGLAPDLVRVQGMGCPSSIGIWPRQGVFLFFFVCMGYGYRDPGGGGMPEFDPYDFIRPFTLYT